MALAGGMGWLDCRHRVGRAGGMRWVGWLGVRIGRKRADGVWRNRRKIRGQVCAYGIRRNGLERKPGGRSGGFRFHF